MDCLTTIEARIQWYTNSKRRLLKKFQLFELQIFESTFVPLDDRSRKKEILKKIIFYFQEENIVDTCCATYAHKKWNNIEQVL